MHQASSGTPIPLVSSLAASNSPLAINEVIRRLGDVSGLPFCSVDLFSRSFVGTDLPLPAVALPAPLADAMQTKAPSVVAEFDGLLFYLVRLKSLDEYAAGYIPADANFPSQAVQEAARSQGWSDERLAEWGKSQLRGSEATVRRLLKLAEQQLRLEESHNRSEKDAEALATHLHRVYEELSLVHDLTVQTTLTSGFEMIARTAIERVCEVVRPRGAALWVSRPVPTIVATAGQWPISSVAMTEIADAWQSQLELRPIVKNNLSGGSESSRYPGIKSIAGVPIFQQTELLGWLMVCDPMESEELGSEEINLLQSVSGVLSAHWQNLSLFHQQEDMVVGFVRTLVQTIDARDPCTRGHSERVALVGRFLARRLGLPSDEVDTVHLSGLLHDIGKIGIDDAVLRKPGALNKDEILHIRQHPVIGDRILAELRQFDHVRPGVRHHHEAYDGTGYPDRIAGEQIPLMARILAVADAYDAMASDRPYRKGCERSVVERILRDGAGGQWDPDIIAILLRCADQIHSMWTTAHSEHDKLHANHAYSS
jgi:hypothetical protein